MPGKKGRSRFPRKVEISMTLMTNCSLDELRRKAWWEKIIYAGHPLVIHDEPDPVLHIEFVSALPEPQDQADKLRAEMRRRENG